MVPAFRAAAKELEPMMRLGKFDTEAEQAIAGRYGIRLIPTMILFLRRTEVMRASGSISDSGIVRWARQEFVKAAV
jgi:thioredoxin 2